VTTDVIAPTARGRLAFHCPDIPFFFDALGEPGVTEAAGPALA
jgi:hypothetical protein